ncbi:alpha/beta fold family hydrolase [Nitzschia inconspicua]|uniref:Alpha/beta fold family hydrolase n=1 Tax=Nitzschia inconspicua TaxID=303405 RepID=A0A9K3PP94_9STRA|nr:alpha/beta fold family hydrolase [Nitzschia inconspicua]
MNIDANNLTFTCTELKHDAAQAYDKSKNIMLLHGFPMYRVWWQPLFEYWNELLLSSIDASSTSPMHVVACDLRGYSDGASPDDIEQYTYDVFAEDIFAIAENAFGVGVSFHLMGYDHGAALA